MGADATVTEESFYLTGLHKSLKNILMVESVIGPSPLKRHRRESLSVLPLSFNYLFEVVHGFYEMISYFLKKMLSYVDFCL